MAYYNVFHYKEVPYYINLAMTHLIDDIKSQLSQSSNLTDYDLSVQRLKEELKQTIQMGCKVHNQRQAIESKLFELQTYKMYHHLFFNKSFEELQEIHRQKDSRPIPDNLHDMIQLLCDYEFCGA